MKITYDIALLEATKDTVEVVTPRNGHNYDGQKPSWFHVHAEFPTLEEAQAFAAQFPKSLRMRATTLAKDKALVGYIRMEVGFSMDGVNQGVNETGIRRIKTLVRTCEKLGVELVRVRRWGNSAARDIADYGWLD